ncbi:HEPN domain-containing protein, partial [Candidatus Bipolaricaulota bacterium]|nr:HEPN domain-containing protein [Candidatus Bipolaricaulota bacterium]
AVLDGYYVSTRYPNSLPGSIPAHVYQKDAAQDALQLAEEVVAFVEKRLD